MAVSIINLEDVKTTIDLSMKKLRLELSTMRRIGINQVKVIHGGAVKTATHECLRTMKSEGRIKDFCPGEQFGPFEQSGRTVVTLCPSFRNDPDWARLNDAVTVVVLK